MHYSSLPLTILVKILKANQVYKALVTVYTNQTERQINLKSSLSLLVCRRITCGMHNNHKQQVCYYKDGNNNCANSHNNV